MNHLLLASVAGAGLLLGLLAVTFITVRRDPVDHRLTTTAGWGYATTWLAALTLRLGFAYGSTHWFTDPLAAFSRAHHITSNTYAAAFVLMVLAMIGVRTATVLIRGRAAGATIPTGNLHLARRFTA